MNLGVSEKLLVISSPGFIIQEVERYLKRYRPFAASQRLKTSPCQYQLIAYLPAVRLLKNRTSDYHKSAFFTLKTRAIEPTVWKLRGEALRLDVVAK
ncbi:hypothetical protein chiPu_0021486 [Chiloscyllium punctatum]|uniref:Uncharacterized protein n=1 Tax=Chiloscyllium punctatum TaxID=137246 RepID=A0A401RG10_CHIPU|nr:hypothetical protein [Chiloscyllium punctatum]